MILYASDPVTGLKVVGIVVVAIKGFLRRQGTMLLF